MAHRPTLSLRFAVAALGLVASSCGATAIGNRGATQAGIAAELDRRGREGDRVSERTLAILRELRAMQPEGEDPLGAIEARADAMVRRTMLYAALAGSAVSVVFWGGYLVAKRLAAR